MRFVVRTPAETVAEYDLPGLDSRSSDQDLLAAAAEAEPIRRGGVEIVGQPYVYARGLDSLTEQGKRLQQLEDRLKDEKAAARLLAQQMLDGGMTKHSIAATLGITRPTLDAWLGKRARRRGR